MKPCRQRGPYRGFFESASDRIAMVLPGASLDAVGAMLPSIASQQEALAAGNAVASAALASSPTGVHHVHMVDGWQGAFEPFLSRTPWVFDVVNATTDTVAGQQETGFPSYGFLGILIVIIFTFFVGEVLVGERALVAMRGCTAPYVDDKSGSAESRSTWEKVTLAIHSFI